MAMSNLLSKIFFVFLLFSWEEAVSQSCSSIFPDGASNSDVGGSINFEWNSRVTNSPDDTLDSNSLTGFWWFNFSCDGVACNSSGSIVPDLNFPSISTGANINVGYNSTQILLPGSYGSLSTAYISTVIFSPGVYTFSGNFLIGSSSNLEIPTDGTVIIYVNGTTQFNNQADVNRVNTSSYLFFYGNGVINLDSPSFVDALIYGGDRVNIASGAVVNGAVTAEGEIDLDSPSTINYDPDMVSDGDYASVCTGASGGGVSPIAEWRLDDSSWNGTAGEVVDSVGGLNGSAVSIGGFSNTQLLNPALSGNPGTCRSGFFSESDGYLRIADDPILNLSEFTITAWINPASWPSSGLASIISKDENYEFHITPAGQLNWWWNTASGPTEITTSLTGGLINNWHHVAITYESGSQIIYIDGVAAASSSSTATIQMTNDDLLIGTDHDSFTSSRRFDGLIDEVKIFNTVLSFSDVNSVMAERHECDNTPVVDDISINVSPGTASTCAPAEIEISILDASDNAITTYTGAIALSTSTGNGSWSLTGVAANAQGTFTAGSIDSGTATYAFEATGADLGVVRLSLANEHAETTIISGSDADASVVGGSNNLTYSENAFVVTSTDGLGDDTIAGRSHDFQAVMMRRDPSTGDCGVAIGYSEANVKVWLSRDSEDPSGVAPLLTNSNSSSTLLPPDSQPANNNFTLNFSNGVANFDLLASDVGKYGLQFLDDSTNFSDVDILGGSSSFVARPFAFYLEVAFNPASPDASGGVFTSAGSDFSVTVKAVAWESADDVGDDGIADGHNDTNPANNANLSNNAVLANFGQENTAEGVVLASYLVSPIGGVDGGLGSSTSPADAREISSFTPSGGTTNNVYFGEVGVIELVAELLDGSYMGVSGTFSDRIVGRSGNVGRFNPSRFTLVSSGIVEACEVILPFSYLGQPFSVSYQLDALNTRDGVTQNYQGNYAKLFVGSGSLSFGSKDQLTSVNLTARISVGASSFTWLNGSGNVSSALTVARAVAPDGVFTQADIGVVPTDTDGVTLNPSEFNLDVDTSGSDEYATLDQTLLKFGRLNMEGAFGPETANLPVKMQAEYWDGEFWIVNADDSCTALSQDSVIYPEGTIDIVGNRTVAIDASNTTGIYGILSAGDIVFSLGDAEHYFTAPGTGNTGSFNVDVNLINYPWLRFDWDQDGDYDNDTSLTTVTHTFGLYRGHDRIISWREVLH